MLKKIILVCLWQITPLAAFTVFSQTEPVAQPQQLTFSQIKAYGFSLSFQPVQADGYLIIRSVNQPVSFVPSDNVFYEKGMGVGNGKVISMGNINAVNVQDVQENTEYHFSIFAYNQSGTQINYKQDAPLSGSVVSAKSLPGNYYDGINFHSPQLIDQLTALLRNHSFVSYSLYGSLMIPTIYERDTTGGNKVVTCDYSGEHKIYAPPFSFSATGYSREHVLPRSWMPSGGNISTPERADYFNLLLTNQNQVNALRSNYPLGNVVTPTVSYLGCTLGKNATNKTVFEPRDLRKGDAARALFYQLLCYNGVAGNWGISYLASLGPQQDIATLINWHFQDPPDAFEKAKQEYIYSIQHNRNPFIDFPDLVYCIDFSTLLPNSPCNPVSTTHSTAPFYNIQIYPNPACSIIQIASEIPQEMLYVLLDQTGRIVKTGKIPSHYPQLSIIDLPDGLYQMLLKTQDGTVCSHRIFTIKQ